MKQSFTAQELSEILDITIRAVQLRAKDEGWRFVEEASQGGKKRLYHFATLPGEVKSRVTEAGARETAATAERATVEVDSEGARLWAGLSAPERALALARLEIMRTADRFVSKKSSQGRVAALENFYTALQAALRAASHPAFVRLGFAEDKIAEIIANVRKVSIQTDYRWRSEYSEAEKTYGMGLLGLCRKKRECEGFGAKCVSPDMKAFIRTLIQKNQVKLFEASKASGRLVNLNKKLLYGRLKNTYGEENLPSYSHFTRWVNEFLAGPDGEELCAIVLPSYWMANFAPKAGSLSEDVEYAGERWHIDGTTADIMLSDGRYEIIVAIDVYSRDLVLEIQKHASSITVAKVIMQGLLRWGKPDEIKPDRGSVFLSRHIESACRALEIHLNPCRAYAPWEKAIVESAIGSIGKMLFEALPWFTGHHPGQRKRIEEYGRFKQVFFGKRGEKHAVACDVTVEEFRAIVDNWLEKVYRIEPHEFADRAMGRSGVVWERIASSPRRAPKMNSVEALDMLLAPAFEREFNSGVEWNTKPYLPLDVAGWQKAQEFARRQVYFRPCLSDISRGGIWEIKESGATGKFICHVSCQGLKEESLEEYNQAKRAIAREHKKRRAAVDLTFGPPSYADELERMPMPKVAAAGFGAVEYGGESYRSVAEPGPPVNGFGRKGTLTEEARAAIRLELLEKERSRANDGLNGNGFLKKDDASEIRICPPVNGNGTNGDCRAQVSVPGWLTNGVPNWGAVESMPQVEQYGALLEAEASGMDIPRHLLSAMRYFEASDVYVKLESVYEKKKAELAALRMRRS